MKWKAWLAILFIVFITLFNYTWGWGVLFLIWVIPDILRGKTYLMEEVSRKESPLTFWTIVLLWVLISTYMLLSYIFPALLMSA